jgi:hypothetical protein
MPLIALAIAVVCVGAPLALADLKQIEEMIQRDGRIHLPSEPEHKANTKTAHEKGGSAKSSHATSLQAVDRTHTAYMKLAQSLYKGKTLKTVTAITLTDKKPIGSHVTTVGGDLPAGFGKDFNWDRKDQAIKLAVIVNPADPLGVSISGLKKGDTIEVTSATGLGSFSKNTGHPLLSSIVGALAEGTKAYLDSQGDQQYDSIVDTSSKLITDQLKATGDAQQFRDPFGLDPAGGWGLEEGGVLLCMPQAQGPYYSGDPDHRDHWATQPRRVTDRRGLPAYLAGQARTHPFFFLGRSTKNSGVCEQDGEAYLLAWDFAFTDNAGFYKVFVTVSQPSTKVTRPIGGDQNKQLPTQPPIILDKSNKTGKGGER